MAIKEFNNENQNMKIGKTTDNINDFRFPLGKNELKSVLKSIKGEPAKFTINTFGDTSLYS